MKRFLAALAPAARRLPPAGRIGLALVLCWACMALIGPAIAPHPPGAVVSAIAFDGSSARFWLGTDHLGRDVLSRILAGARSTLLPALSAAVLTSAVGHALGLFAVVAGQYASAVLDRVAGALLSIPGMMLALLVAAAFGASTVVLLLIAILVYAPGAYRVARSLAADIQRREHVQTARLRGERRTYIACVEILPSMVRPLLVDAGSRFVSIVLLVSGLGFLGLGVRPPDADLGLLVRENLAGLPHRATPVLAPALAIATLTIGLTLLLDSLAGKGPRPGDER
jgi:peptide/nickel transport system permease protein